MAGAIELYEKSCDLGRAASCAVAGLWYLDGKKGVRKNYAKALALDTKACDGDDGAACTNLGFLYGTGKGVERDIRKAAALYDTGCKLGSKAGCDNLRDARWKLALEASDLWRSYSANEVAADDKWKGRSLHVVGTLQSIGKDFADDVILQLRSPNQFMPTRAYLNESETDTAATLRKGQRVLLTCTCQGRIVGSPVLKNCTIDDFANAVRNDDG